MEHAAQQLVAAESVASTEIAEKHFSFGAVLEVVTHGLVHGPEAVRRRHLEGDVHVGTMAADIQLVPGVRTVEGKRDVRNSMRRTLTRVRASRASKFRR